MKKILLILLPLLTFQILAAKETDIITSEEAVILAKKELLELMLDPGSTNFKIDFSKGMKLNEKDGSYFAATVCGKYNSKNRMGGYNGYQGFAIALNYKNNELTKHIILEEEYKGDANPIFQSLASAICHE